MNKRILLLLALPPLAALALTACGAGGGSSAEDKITETIETAVGTADPANCTELETLRFVEQSSLIGRKGKAAVENCEKVAEAETEQAQGAKVSNVSVDGKTATAEVEPQGGQIDSQVIEVALIEEGGIWKLDQIKGFTHYDGKAMAEAFGKLFEDNLDAGSEAEAKCVTGKIAGASRAKAEELFFSGSLQALVKLVEGCE